MSQNENWLLKHSVSLLFLGVIFALVISLLWFRFEMIDPNGDVQKALQQENDKLESIKSDCKALGNYILYNKGSILDPVVREARDIYLVNCK